MQAKEQTTSLSGCMTFNEKIKQLLTKCRSFSQILILTTSIITLSTKTLLLERKRCLFSKGQTNSDMYQFCLPKPPSLSLSLCVCVCVYLFLLICMVAEQFCMTDRALCLLAVGSVLQGEASSAQGHLIIQITHRCPPPPPPVAR